MGDYDQDIQPEPDQPDELGVNEPGEAAALGILGALVFMALAFLNNGWRADHRLSSVLTLACVAFFAARYLRRVRDRKRPGG